MEKEAIFLVLFAVAGCLAFFISLQRNRKPAELSPDIRERLKDPKFARLFRNRPISGGTVGMAKLGVSILVWFAVLSILGSLLLSVLIYVFGVRPKTGPTEPYAGVMNIIVPPGIQDTWGNSPKKYDVQIIRNDTVVFEWIAHWEGRSGHETTRFFWDKSNSSKPNGDWKQVNPPAEGQWQLFDLDGKGKQFFGWMSTKDPSEKYQMSMIVN